MRGHSRSKTVNSKPRPMPPKRLLTLAPKSRIRTLAALLISCSLAGCNIPTNVDHTCLTHTTQASPALKAWFKQLCTADGVCKSPAPPDLAQFLRDVAANNAVIRANCPQIA